MLPAEHINIMIGKAQRSSKGIYGGAMILYIPYNAASTSSRHHDRPAPPGKEISHTLHTSSKYKVYMNAYGMHRSPHEYQQNPTPRADNHITV